MKIKIKTSPGDNKRMKLFIRCRDIFAQIDVNSDGTLTEEEFIKGTILNHHLCHYFISPQTLHIGEHDHRMPWLLSCMLIYPWILLLGCQLDEELISLLTKLFETLLEVADHMSKHPPQSSVTNLCVKLMKTQVRVNLHGVLTKLKLKYCKK